MNTILIIAYHYPPENGSCSEKNTRIVKQFLQSGYAVHVLTGNYIPDVITKDALKIYHTNSGIFHHNISSPTETINNSSNKSGILTKAKKYLSSKAVPDATIDWIYEAIKYISNHPDILDGVDLIFSISSPYSAHLLSGYLSHKTGIPYVMCYGDPWIYEPKRKRGHLRYFIEKKMEGALIKNSSGVALITDWNRREYIRLYHIPENKIYTYLIGYESRDYEPIDNCDNHSVFKLLYGGSLDPTHRNIEPFLRALQNVNDVFVEIRNNDYPKVIDMVWDYGLEGKVEVKPLIPSSEFEKRQYDFDALILFGNKTPFQIPGKVFTYISTGKTIIYIKNNGFSDDGTEEVLRKYGNVIIVNNEKEAIAASLNSFVKVKSTLESNREQFLYQNTMASLIEMAQGAINNK